MDLPSIHVPEKEAEAMRGLERAREDAKEAEQVALSGADEKARADAIKVLRKYARESHRDVFTQALNDPSPGVRREAEKALQGVKD